MAKGENLEKPKKKGGMVIVIGMGAKPKDSMKKSFGRGSDDAKLSSRAKTLRRFKSGRLNIDDILERRKVDPEEFHGEFRRRHGVDFEDYLAGDSANIDPQALIDELAEKRFGAAKKTAIEGQQRRESRAKKIRDGLLNTNKFKGMLRNKNISEGAWKRAVGKIPDSELTSDTFNQLVQRLDNSNVETYDGPTQSYDQIFHEYDRANAGEYDDEEEEKPEPMSEDEQMERIARLLEARYPPEVAEDMARRYLQRGAHFSPSEHEFNVSMRNQDDDEDPMVGFSSASIGAETPKSQTANPRELHPMFPPRAGQGEGMVVRPFQMQTSFDDPKNVMNAAWALLKSK